MLLLCVLIQIQSRELAPSKHLINADMDCLTFMQIFMVFFGMVLLND